jgi:hypothetical protein
MRRFAATWADLSNWKKTMVFRQRLLLQHGRDLYEALGKFEKLSENSVRHMLEGSRFSLETDALFVSLEGDPRLLTPDHKPENEDELRRIRASRGKVYKGRFRLTLQTARSGRNGTPRRSRQIAEVPKQL